MLRVLFVCMGNSCRSPMAEVIARHEARRRSLPWQFQSAGTDAGGFVHEFAADAVKDLENIAGREGIQVNSELIAWASLVLVMDRSQLEDPILQAAAGRKHLLAEFAGTGDVIADPFGGTRADYLACRRSIEESIRALLTRISG